MLIYYLLLVMVLSSIVRVVMSGTVACFSRHVVTARMVLCSCLVRIMLLLSRVSRWRRISRLKCPVLLLLLWIEDGNLDSSSMGLELDGFSDVYVAGMSKCLMAVWRGCIMKPLRPTLDMTLRNAVVAAWCNLEMLLVFVEMLVEFAEVFRVRTSLRWVLNNCRESGPMSCALVLARLRLKNLRPL